MNRRNLLKNIGLGAGLTTFGSFLSPKDVDAATGIVNTNSQPSELKITDLRVHDLRHNFAALGASAGLSLPVIGALLGHSNPTTTQRYAHLMPDARQAAAEIIGRQLVEPEGESAEVVSFKDGAT